MTAPDAPSVAADGTIPGDPIAGWRVLVPRGGRWGEDATARLAEAGAAAVVVPLVEFAPPVDAEPMRAAMARLTAGAYDWVLVTSPTEIDAVIAAGGVVPSTTKVAVLGEIVAAAATAAGTGWTARGCGPGPLRSARAGATGALPRAPFPCG